jgi:segregation and condensation protein B
LENNQAPNSNPNPEKPETPNPAPVETQPIRVKAPRAEAKAVPAEAPREEAAELETSEKKRQRLVWLEAALYVVGRPININEICQVLNTRSKKKALQLVKELIAEYAARSTAIEILELKDERYVMQVKADFTPLVKRLVNRPLLSSGPLKTLSYIAYRQPITSKRVIEVRGQHAYGHIKLLKDMGLIAPERSGRAIVLKTTDYFADYFGLMQDTSGMKRDLKRIFGEALKEEHQP